MNKLMRTGRFPHYAGHILPSAPYGDVTEPDMYFCWLHDYNM